MDFAGRAIAAIGRGAGFAIATLVACAGAMPAQARNTVTPLFASSEPINIEISGPVGAIARAAQNSTEPREATLTANGETLAIDLAARGITRRKSDVCAFPPLSIRFRTKPANSSLFDGQKKLKLVTHCQQRGQFEQFLLKEYTAYRLYNQLSDESFKVRLARIRYVDNGRAADEHWGFFIEDADDLASRLGRTKIELTDLPSSVLDREDAARYTLFQYMIGNLDWAMTQGPVKDDCCHNSKLIGATLDARTGITPVPYDFDYSGLVNPPYAVPPDGIPVRSVTQRYYRGLCRHNAETRRVAAQFAASRGALDAEIDQIPALEPRSRNAMKTFLAGFFTDLARPDFVENRLIKGCR